jgi:hypothetical protein
MRLSELAADLDMEEAGVWVPYRDEVEFKIAAASSKRAMSAYRKHLRPVERRIAAGNIKEDEAAVYVARFIARGLLLDWRGVDDDDGNPLAYTPALGEQVLTQPDMKYVRRFIQESAAEQDVFKTAAAEGDVAALKSVEDLGHGGAGAAVGPEVGEGAPAED